MPSPPIDVAQLKAGELRERLAKGEPLVVLDVREDPERAYCAIPVPPTATDLHIPMAQVAARLEELRGASRAAPLVVYCHHGMRSMTVASWLALQGLNPVANLDGGIDAWSTQVDPGVRRY